MKAETLDQAQVVNSLRIGHYACETCYPDYPAEAFCGHICTQLAGSDHQVCVVCDELSELPCQTCGNYLGA